MTNTKHDTPILFALYASDLDEEIDGFVAKFTDNMKIAGVASSLEEVEKLQKDR